MFFCSVRLGPFSCDGYHLICKLQELTKFTQNFMYEKNETITVPSSFNERCFTEKIRTNVFFFLLVWKLRIITFQSHNDFTISRQHIQMGAWLPNAVMLRCYQLRNDFDAMLTYWWQIYSLTHLPGLTIFHRQLIEGMQRQLSGIHDLYKQITTLLDLSRRLF